MDIVEKLCQTNQISAIVIDSVAQIVPMAVSAKEIDGTANIATTARLMSQTLPRLSNAADRSGTVLIFINQLRMNVGQMYGNPETTPGGRALKFASSLRIDVRASKPEEHNGKECVPIKITVKKNKYAPPFRKTELWLELGQGFDVIADMLETAMVAGIIEKSGGWFSYKEMKEQGWEKFAEKIRADEKICSEILTTLRELKA
jgi:recombination protein RecA